MKKATHRKHKTPKKKAIKSNPKAFKKALAILASDRTYRNRALKDPVHILEDFKLSEEELKALHEVAVLSGVDMSEISKLRPEDIPESVNVTCTLLLLLLLR